MMFIPVLEYLLFISGTNANAVLIQPDKTQIATMKSLLKNRLPGRVEAGKPRQAYRSCDKNCSMA
jgi:hypothetical protein